MSGDETLVDHCQRSGLEPSDPRYIDIHSGVAVRAFSLSCHPSKKGLESIDKGHMRHAAKAVAFGTLYDQSPRSCAILLRQSGTFITEHEAQKIQASLFDTYPLLKRFLQSAANRVDVGWLKTMFGRVRRFTHANNKTERSKMAREARNAPIQGGVADAVSIAIRNIYDYRNEHKMHFRIAMQIHDAIILAVPYYELQRVINKDNGVLKECMITRVPLYHADLLGNKIGTNPYYFNSSCDVMSNWGLPPLPDVLQLAGEDPLDYGWTKTSDQNALVHKELKNYKYDLTNLSSSSSNSIV
jgi:DNA polymerase I-like protein with 3'-5' exonuclease and polymerase domains